MVTNKSSAMNNGPDKFDRKYNFAVMIRHATRGRYAEFSAPLKTKEILACFVSMKSAEN